MPDAKPKKTIFEYFKEYVGPVVVVGGLIGGGVLAWADTQNAISTNETAITGILDTLKTKSTKFMTDQEFDKLWEEIRDNISDVEALKARLEEMNIRDERLGARIELEISKLASEIERIGDRQEAAQEQQQRTLDAILREIQSSD